MLIKLYFGNILALFEGFNTCWIVSLRCLAPLAKSPRQDKTPAILVLKVTTMQDSTQLCMLWFLLLLPEREETCEMAARKESSMQIALENAAARFERGE